MKIVFIITDLGSFNNFLSELATELIKDQSIHLHVICANYKVINIQNKNDFPNQNFHFHFLDIPRSVSIVSQLKIAYRIRKVLDDIKPDIVHAHFTTGTLPTILFKNNAYTYWGTFHGLGMNSSKGFKKILFTLVETFCFVRLNKIYVLNKQDYLLLDSIGIKKGVQYKSKGIGCDILRFDTKNFTPIMNNDTKSDLNISDQFVICFTGRFVDFKGFHLVIKAFFKLTEKYPDKFKLILLGGRDSIHACGLSSSEEERMNSHKDIIAVGYTSDVAKYLAISDVFLFPSKKEGLPTCVLESISMGVPVITMNSRGNNDIIVDGYNGFLIEPTLNVDDTIKEIIYAIENIYIDNDLKIKLSNNALKDRKEVSRQKFIEEHKLLYSQIPL